MKQFIRNTLPPFFLKALKLIIDYKYGWHGHYDSWSSALNDSVGYDSVEILQKVRASLLKVKNGEAVYERDSVLFQKIEYSWPLLSALLLSAVKSDRISVLDFGGSLGSSYYQNKKFLDQLTDVKWSIVEQKHFVEVGNNEFKDNRLKFYSDANECVSIEKPNVLLLSSVIQYIEKPFEFLQDLLSFSFEYIIIDRTPFSTKNQDEIKLQVVPPSIYKASYPCWFFNEQFFKDFFISRDYQLIEEFEALDGRSKNYFFKGIIFNRNDKKM